MLACVLLLTVTGCKKRKEAGDGAGGGAAAERSVDVSADKAAARSSWLLKVAEDSTPLLTLAGTSDGWRHVFTGKPVEALAAFEADLAKSEAARIGAARAALELAFAHRNAGRLVVALTPAVLDAQKTLPGADGSAPHRAFVAARLAQRTGEQPALEALAGTPLAALAVAAAPGAAGPEGALLRGEAAGADASPPAGGTDAWAERLALRALVAAGRLREARARMDRLDARAPDLVAGEGTAAVRFRDPVVAGVEAHVYAAVALAALEGVGGWADLLRAQAQLVLGQASEAAATLEKLIAAPPADPPLALLVLSPALDAADLTAWATALRAAALAEAGQVEPARTLAGGLGTETVGRRVFRNYALAFTGQKAAPDAFPADRGVLGKALLDEVEALGEGAKGKQDLVSLSLVERYLDALQRLDAQAQQRGGDPTLAVKAREASEDKAHAAELSERNSMSSLAATAYDNVAIGRPRVALKYLSRLEPALPTVGAPAEMLRDLLSLRAMEQGGGATAGQ